MSRQVTPLDSHGATEFQLSHFHTWHTGFQLHVDSVGPWERTLGRLLVPSMMSFAPVALVYWLVRAVSLLGR